MFRFVPFMADGEQSKGRISTEQVGTRDGQPGPLDSPLAGRLLKRQQVDDSAFAAVVNHLNFACCFCRRGVFALFWCHVIAYIRD